MIINSSIILLLMTFAIQTPGVEPLFLGSPVQGSLGPGQRAGYQLEIHSRSNVAFIIEKTSGSTLEPGLLIRDISGTTVGSHHPEAGSRILRAVHNLQPGSYTVTLEGRSGTSGSFRLQALTVQLMADKTVSTTAGDPRVQDESMHIIIKTGSLYDNRTGTLRQGDVHRYRVNLEKKSHITITSWGVDPGLRPCFVLKNGRGDYLGEGTVPYYKVHSVKKMREVLPGGSYLVDTYGCSDTFGRYQLEISGEPYSYQRLWTRITMYALVPAAYLGAAAYARESAWGDNPAENRFGTFNGYMLGIFGGGALGGTLLGMMCQGGSGGEGLGGGWGRIGDLLVFGTIGIVSGIVGGAYLARHYGSDINTSGSLYYGSALVVGFFPAIVYRIGWD
jgi:hypothetical protein